MDELLDEVQPHLPALALQGAKGVGKTATALQRVRTRFDLSDDVVRGIVAADPAELSSAPGPVLVDEWQRLPQVWDAVRRAVDDGAPDGRFIIAGSAAPRGAVVHSGAGRIVPMRLRPLSLAERGIEIPTVSLAGLLNQDADLGGRTTLTLRNYVEEITASGFPGIRRRPRPVRDLTLDAYLDNVVEREFPEQGYPVRKPETLRSWLRAYAAATASPTTYVKILAHANEAKGESPAKTTTLTYRDALSGLFLLDPVAAWNREGSGIARLTDLPKHHLADPALAARLLGLDESALMRGERGTVSIDHGRILGALFEGLVTLSVQTYAQAAQARVFHLRTVGGEREIDLIVERPDGRMVAIEIKLAATVEADDAKHLRWIKATLGDAVVDTIVVHCGPQAYRRDDGVGVVPAALLGA
ncbi:ATP-binding protein [Isoptericola sp. BMS4]|uniref:ATP-binding protein n=1 Tax=Isoptericola sp. BMS4 TaxID=2527875 RepID=UPI001F0F0C50|nr:DUF4143 domain-containing protein [Isoptericola sp. BMS4]